MTSALQDAIVTLNSDKEGLQNQEEICRHYIEVIKRAKSLDQWLHEYFKLQFTDAEQIYEAQDNLMSFEVELPP